MRTALVTGGGTGIGRAVAERLSADGTQVIIVGRREQVLAEAAAEINKANANELVGHRSADLSDPEQVQDLADAITAEAGVDFLINNAGGVFGGGGTALAEIAEGYRKDFTGNVITTVLLTQALLPAITRPGGRIVMMSSIAGLRGGGSYGVAKAALHGYVWDLASKLAAEEITVNAIAPGFVPDTEFWEGRRDEATVGSRLAQIPMNRAGTPAEIAEAVAYFCSREAGWTTGQILQLNGGGLLGRG
jgi:3-oxoacyl-[acyl-carrier protein] reductase